MHRSENKWLPLGKQSQACSLSLLGPSSAVHVSGHTAPRRGCTRMSVPNQGRVSVIIIKPAPEKHPTLQGPVAHFCKEPKMLLAFVKLFFPSPLSVPSTCAKHCTAAAHVITLTPCISILHSASPASSRATQPSSLPGAAA